MQAFQPLTISDIAELLDVCERTIRNYVDQGSFPAPVTICGKKYWHPEVFYLWLDKTVPIYAGGRVSAQVQQARHNHERAAQELAATRERIAVEVTRQYQAVVNGAQRIEALVVAVESSMEALHGTQMGYQLGTRTVLDVLDAEERRYRAQLDLTQARLEYTLARLALASVVGRLDANVIEQIDGSYFGPEMIVLR